MDAHRIVRLVAVTVLAASLPLRSAHVTLADQNVDPGTLNPPPPGSNVTCQATGSQILCRSSLTTNVSNLDLGPACQVYGSSFGFDLVATLDMTIDFTYRYDLSGSLQEDVAHVMFHETDVNGTTGQRVQITGSYTITRDDTTGILRFAGQIGSMTSPGNGLLAHDVGLATFSPGSQPVIHGPHDLLTGTDIFRLECGALAA
jgi:hypothetical protein